VITEYFDAVIITTESNLSKEPKANRYHWARMFQNSGLETYVIQPAERGEKTFEGLEEVTFIYGGPAAFSQKQLKGLIESGKRLLFWNYGSIYSDVIPRDRGTLVHHATEDYLSPSFPWQGDPQKYLGDLVRLMSRSDLIVSVSEGVAKNVKKVISSEVKQVVVRNAYDDSSFFIEKQKDLNSKTFIFQGGVNDRIDWDVVFELASEYRDYKFDFYGAVNLPHQILNQMPPNLELFGQVSSEILRKAISNSTAALIPYKDEPWLKGSLPLKFFEYLACGVPVYTSRIDSVLELGIGAFDIASLIPKNVIKEFSESEKSEIVRILTENTYESRLAEVERHLTNFHLTKIKLPNFPKACIIYDSASLHVETIREHLISFYCLSGFEVFFISSRDRQVENFEVFEVVIIHYSVRLCFSEHLPLNLKSKIQRYKGLKCAFLQDEYDNTEFAIQNILDLGVKVVFTCVDESRVTEVYGPLVLKGVNFKQILTGFAFAAGDKDDYIVPTSLRKWDLGYRGRRLSHRYGRLGFEKWQIGELANTQLIDSGLRLNISSENEDRIYGDLWFDFLGNCRAVLGTESGANVFDFDGNLEILSQKESEMDFVEFENKYLQDRELEGLMNQVSPRIFEAISTKTALVLFPGSYSGVLEPWKHYFPLEKDFSNKQALLEFLNDHESIKAMSERVFVDVVVNGNYGKFDYVSKIAITLRENLKVSIQNRTNAVPDAFKYFPSNFERGIENSWTQNNTSSWQTNFKFYKFVRILWRTIPTRIRYKIAWYLPSIEKKIRSFTNSFKRLSRNVKSFNPRRKR
jgi:glycosyltransferase involved in cell wall biosynthesis